MRGSLYGKSSIQTSPDGGTFYRQTIGTSFIGDLELNYRLTKQVEITGGANNIFNKRPPTYTILPGAAAPYTIVNGGNVYDAPLTFSPYGINGGYYYARLNVRF